jgi:hypothetical protein
MRFDQLISLLENHKTDAEGHAPIYVVQHDESGERLDIPIKAIEVTYLPNGTVIGFGIVPERF